MTIEWFSTYYLIQDGEDKNGNHCFEIIDLTGRTQGKYAYGIEKAISIAERLTGNNPLINSLSDSCIDCRRKKGHTHCNHVYVIEMERRALTERANAFRKFPPESDDSMCYYVGSTSHKCECRWRQHKLHFLGYEAFPCNCFPTFTETKMRLFRGHGGVTKGSPMAGEFGFRLRPDLFSDWNHIISKGNLKNKEKELAKEINETTGAGVIQN